MPNKSALVFDIETNGLLDVLDRIHCLAIKDTETKEVWSYTDDSSAYPGIAEGLSKLAQADVIIPHNGIKFDIPAIKKVHPDWSFSGTVRDSFVMSRVIWPHLLDIDRKKKKYYGDDYKLPGNLFGAHGLKAWGIRLNEHKGDYQGGWDSWSQEMHDYCIQDVEVTDRLWSVIQDKELDPICCELEHQVAWIIARQERHGFLFDHEAARSLALKLQSRSTEIEEELRRMFPPWFVNKGRKVPARKNTQWKVMVDGFAEASNKKDAQEYDEKWAVEFSPGAAFSQIERREFNPGSRDHFTDRLQKLHGWEPEEFGKDGKPTLDAEMLETLDFPGVDIVKEYLMIDKRLGQLINGRNGWIRMVNPDTNRIHGNVNTNGAITGRMTHSRPNMAQVPGGKAPYGPECRALFTVPEGYILLGADASALELCALAGYMAPFDNGAYITEVLYGSTDEAKERGEDMHSNNCRALGLEPKTRYPVQGQSYPGRELAKRWFYAFIYGAGDEKLGRILGEPKGPKARKAGKISRSKFLSNLPGLAKLVARIGTRISSRGYLTGLDGRKLYIRSNHAALNTLLQSAGAVIMKEALVILDQDLQLAHGLAPGTDYEFVANVHDEWQIECREDLAELIGKASTNSMKLAGESFNFPCEISGSFDIGKNWKETH